MLNIAVLITFIIVVLLAVFLNAIHQYIFTPSTNTNPQFSDFQKKYFLAYFPALFADWLNAPYLYYLFSDYGFLEEQIAVIYVCGFASTLIFGTTGGHLVNRYGTTKMTVVGALAYVVSCFLKLSPDYSTLIMSRILSGGGASLLFTAYDVWYSKCHLEKLDFPREWIELTSLKASLISSALAACAGIVAYTMTAFIGRGPVAPSLLAVPFLIFSVFIVQTKWKTVEKIDPDTSLSSNNELPKANKFPKFSKVCCEGLQNIVQNNELLVIGCVQSLFESVFCIFVFLWTPVLDHHNPPLGIVFASFMAATICGGCIFRLLTNSGKLSAGSTLTCALAVACIAILGCVLSTSPTNEFPILSYFSFLIFETAAGCYFPALSFIKQKIKPELQTQAVTSWFRVPLNLIACFGLLLLHHSTNVNGTRKLFIFCFSMVGIAVLLSLRLPRLKPPVNDSNKTSEPLITMENL